MVLRVTRHVSPVKPSSLSKIKNNGWLKKHSGLFLPRFSWTFLRLVIHSTIGFNTFRLNSLFNVFVDLMLFIYLFDAFIGLSATHASIHSFIHLFIGLRQSFSHSLFQSFTCFFSLFIQSLILNSIRALSRVCYESLSFLHQLSHSFRLFHSYTRELIHSHMQSWMHLLIHRGI